MNSSLSKLAPNLSHDNIFRAMPIWRLRQNQIRFLLKLQIWRITLCQQGRGGEIFGKKMKEMWIQNGSIKSLSGDFRRDNVLLHKKKKEKNTREIMDIYVKGNDT